MAEAVLGLRCDDPAWLEQTAGTGEPVDFGDQDNRSIDVAGGHRAVLGSLDASTGVAVLGDRLLVFEPGRAGTPTDDEIARLLAAITVVDEIGFDQRAAALDVGLGDRARDEFVASLPPDATAIADGNLGARRWVATAAVDPRRGALVCVDVVRDLMGRTTTYDGLGTYRCPVEGLDPSGLRVGYGEPQVGFAQVPPSAAAAEVVGAGGEVGAAILATDVQGRRFVLFEVPLPVRGLASGGPLDGGDAYAIGFGPAVRPGSTTGSLAGPVTITVRDGAGVVVAQDQIGLF